MREVNTKKDFHNMRISNHQYSTKGFPTLAEKLGITTGHSTLAIEKIKTNVLIWRMFMSSSMKAAIHLGPNYLTNQEVHKNTNFEEIQSLFNITQKKVLDHSEEILNVNTIERTSLSWTKSTLSHNQVIKWTRVYSDCAPCLEKMYEHSDAIERCIDWTRKGNGEICLPNSEEVKTCATKSSQDWTFLRPGDVKKWYGKCKYNLQESGIPQVRRWYSKSRKQITQSLQVPVH